MARKIPRTGASECSAGKSVYWFKQKQQQPAPPSSRVAPPEHGEGLRQEVQKRLEPVRCATPDGRLHGCGGQSCKRINARNFETPHRIGTFGGIPTRASRSFATALSPASAIRAPEACMRHRVGPPFAPKLPTTLQPRKPVANEFCRIDYVR